MKQFEVKALGLEELSFSEQNLNGGVAIPTVPVLPIVISDFIDGIIQGFKDGFNK